MKALQKSAVLVFGLSMLPVQQGMAVTTGLDFAGGCPGANASPGTLCATSGQPTETNVAAILGLTPDKVTEVFHADVEGDSGVDPYGATGIFPESPTQSGDWWIGTTGVNYVTFKAGGYFVLAKVQTGLTSGTYMMADPVTAWGTDVSLPCPATICTGGDYSDSDFLVNGGNVAALSNFRGYQVIPIPAAVWLFGSGLLGLVGIARRRRS